MKQKERKYIIGIDEVGRGPFAGPVCVGVCIVPEDFKRTLSKNNAPKKLADSKKLSEKQRKEWVRWIRKQKIPHCIESISAKEIDTIHIHHAINKAAQRGVEKILKKTGIRAGKIIAEGSIKITPPKPFVYKAFPKADENIPAVSLASIVAKVYRDTKMEQYGKKYPQYKFEEHKGYGTYAHRKILTRLGPTPIHRLTFIGKYNTLKPYKNSVKRQNRTTKINH